MAEADPAVVVHGPPTIAIGGPGADNWRVTMFAETRVVRRYHVVVSTFAFAAELRARIGITATV